MRVTIISGARPNFMKIAPICRAIDAARDSGKDITYRLVYTGRKDDPALDASLFSDLNMREPDCYLGVNAQGHSEVAAQIMLAFEKELDAHPSQVVLVVDDMTATMSCAIVAKKRGLKVAHVIAGTRSFDMNMPREVNRTIVDAISDYLFTAGMVANRNLNQEGMIPEYIHYVGNILIDTIRYNRHRFTQPIWFDSMGLRKGNYLLLTLNRRDLLARRHVLTSLLQIVIEKSEGLPIIAPLHGYVEDAVKDLGIQAPNLHLLPTQSYLNFGFLINQAKGIVTDSGNIAEEATFLDVPCITLDSYAEHPETWRIGTNELVGDNTFALAAAMDKLMHGEWKHTTLPDRWDGRTAERIVQTMLNVEKV
ncbi:MAG: UDP-N-acetyl glucosamine 2-epimerase [Bacteroidaceae bacterium]|nr:UDP-N-acetyl glucosamine 2-epimerase [Bacteroidaceae bacterium]